MAIEKDEMDIDNFIREKLALMKGGSFDIDPSPDFCKTTMAKICEIDRRRSFLITYGMAISVTLAPPVAKHIWLLIRNDYFSLGGIPLGGYIVPFYQFLISISGSFILLLTGGITSLIIIRRQHNQERSSTKTKLA
jgi:hypothetical protein